MPAEEKDDKDLKVAEALEQVRMQDKEPVCNNQKYVILKGSPRNRALIEVYRTMIFDNQSGEPKALPDWLQMSAERSLRAKQRDQPLPLLDFDGKDINLDTREVMDPDRNDHFATCCEQDSTSDEDLPLCPAFEHDSDSDDTYNSQERKKNWLYARIFTYGNHVPHLMRADISTALYSVELFSSVNFILEVARSERVTLIFHIYTVSFIAVTLTSFVFALVLANEEMERQIDENDSYTKNEVGAENGRNRKWIATTFWLTLSYLVLKPRTLVDIFPRIHPRGNCPGTGAAKLFGSRLFYATFLSEAHFKAEDQEGLECMFPLLLLKSGFEVVMQLVILSVTPLSNVLLLQVAVKVASFMWQLWQWYQLLIIRKRLFAQASGIWLENCANSSNRLPEELQEKQWNYKRKLWEHVFQKHFPHVLGKDLKTCWPSLRFAPGPVTAFCLLLVVIVNTLSAVFMIYFAHFADHKDETQQDFQDLLH